MKLCNLKICIALQELGYNGDYYAWIDADNGTVETDTGFIYDWHIPCPRLDDAAYWLREKFGLMINITYIHGCRAYFPKVCDMFGYYESNAYPGSSPNYDTALEAAVEKAIEIVKATKK